MKLPQTKRQRLTNLILLALERAVDGYIRVADFTYHPEYYAYGGGWQYSLKKATLAKSLKRLREGGLIEFVDDEELAFRLTDKGREKAIIASFNDPNQRWDGKWRMVIFDIPEKRRTARDLLRYRLKSWGFTLWQKSVWVTKKNCTEPLRKYLKQIGVEDWVLVVESSNIGR